MSIINFNDLYDESTGIMNLDEGTKAGISQIESDLDIFYEHIIKYKYNPSHQSNSWIGSILNSHRDIIKLTNSKTVKNMITKEIINKHFLKGLNKAKENNKIPNDASNDFDTIDKVIDSNFLYDYLVRSAYNNDIENTLYRKMWM